MDSNADQDHMTQLIDNLAREKARAELTLNRHGFKDNGGEVWDAPTMRMPPEVLLTLERAQTMVSDAHEQRDAAVEVANMAVSMLKKAQETEAKPRVYWPDPSKMNFSPERRDPHSLQDRHLPLRRRSTDIDGKEGNQ